MPDHPMEFSNGRGIGAEVEAEVIVTRDGFSPRYDLDRSTGIVSRSGHDLEGRSIANTIMIIDRAKGGVAAGWAMDELAVRGLAPVAMIFSRLNPVFVQGCGFAGIAVVEGLQPDPLDHLTSGTWCRLFPREGRLEVLSGERGTSR